MKLIFTAASLAFFLLTASAGAMLVAWYPLDESGADPDSVTELVANNDGTTIGFDPDPGLTFITRGHPSARADLGTSYLITKGGGLDLGAAAAVQPTDKFTIAFWFQPLTFNAFDRFLESQMTNTNAQDGIRIDTGGGAGNRVRVLVRDGGAANTQFSHPTILKNDGTWYFFAFRYDSAGVDNAAFQLTLIEANGNPVDGAAVTTATAGRATANTGPIHAPHARSTLIGLEVLGNPGHGNNLHAALDELAFYDNSDGAGVLSDQQLADVYNFGPSGINLINAFSSDLASVAPGNPATLSWEVEEPVDTLTLDDGRGTVTDLVPLTAAGTGTLAVTPSETTTYSLRATRGEAVNISTVRILANAAPDLASFTTSAGIIRTGDSANLSWVVTGADSLTLDPGAMDVVGLTTISVSPTETTTYTLSATNPFGTSTADVTITVITGPVPAHRYVASTAGNDASGWRDDIGTRDWTLTGATYDDPLSSPSPNTNLTAAYFTGGGLSGGATPSFQYEAFTVEIWLRPGVLSPNYELIFETGGGQNGLSVLVNEDELRVLGSALNIRTLDLIVPVSGLNLEDFIQVVVSNNAVGGADAVDVSVRDTSGNVRTASATADVVIGINGGGLFVWASGALGGTENNLGGRTEIAGTSPPGLTGFAGEIAVVNIYDRILDAADIQLNFEGIAGGSGDPLELSVSKSGADLVFEWKSQAGMRYNLRSVLDPSSADRKDWPIHGGHMEIAATPDTNTLTIQRPADAVRFFVIEEILAPPVTVFSENFDGADPGWTTGFDASDTLMNTVWQLGDPNGGPATGPQAANSVPNCYGTNLTTNYGISSNTWLRTPAIDLSTAMAATVIFQQWVDMDEFLNLDHGAVRVLVASGLPGTVTELGVVQADITGFLNGWAEFSAELPAAALGQSIVLEFGFRSDGDDVVAAAGWYIDDVVVTIPGS
ncbi:MAG: LamG-like jellyroll fold domain-containing protein [Roseibacillus sp.]|jgi:hypothetical protein